MDHLTFQSYAPQPDIAGVAWQPLKKHRNAHGSFMEHLRLSNGRIEWLPHFEVRQTGVSVSHPGRINAFHIHPEAPQEELWCALSGEFLVWLADLRPESPTCGNRHSYILTAEEPSHLYIPAGVAHGYKAGPHGGLLLYALTHTFDPGNEGRLPWDIFGPSIWE